ncbi:MAG TPA: hypothetical protein VMM82_08095 [Spirochaetia bacterium]|nr:hypothetical protein [Spirochaetia bacterium]
MSHASKIAVAALALTLWGGAVFAQAASEPKPAWPAYLFSIFLGFGTGQYWAGQNGNLFLVGDASCIGVMGIGAVLGSSGASAGYLMIGASAIAFSVFRIWELIDVFGAVDRAKKAGQVAQLEPVIKVDPSSVEVGVTLRL